MAFKSYLQAGSGRNDGSSYTYNIVDIEFGERFSASLSEGSFDNFDEMKLLMYDKAKEPGHES